MVDKKEIKVLLTIAADAKLDGLDFLSSFTFEQLCDGYNGIGPEFLPPRVRDRVTGFLALFEPAALIHDLRNEYSDGTRQGFLAANDEFRRNCIKLADCAYPWYSLRRYRARAVAQVLYDFVSADSFGWRAWLEAKERHEKKVGENSSSSRKDGNHHSPTPTQDPN